MLEERDRRVVRAMADGIPIVARPYAILAEKAGLTEEEFLRRLRALKERGILRRVGAVLQHRRAGFSANALCVWQIPEERLDEVGAIASREAAVSHCYSRESLPEWPYNFYVMLHAKSREECEKIADRISRESQMGKGQMFYSVREWKKAAMRYFGEPDEK